MKNGKIPTFTDLNVWKEGHNLTIMVYKITKSFPEERYSMVDQMRRASSSITANIAEGFGRPSSKKKVQYYYLSKGSLNELKNFLYTAKDVGYLDEQTFTNLMQQSNIVDQILQGFIKKSKQFIYHSSLIFNRP